MSDLNPGKTFQHLVIAALAGGLIVFALKYSADRILPKPKLAVAAVVQSAPGATQSSAASADEAALQEAELQASIAKQERLKKEHEQNLAEQAKREQKLQEALAARKEVAEQARKDAAWQRFYKKPKKCENPSDNSAIVECGNHYIQEQQRFEKLYADGKI